MALKPSDVEGPTPQNRPARATQKEREAREQLLHQVIEIEECIDAALRNAAKNPRDDGVIIVDLPYAVTGALKSEVERRYLQAGWRKAVCMEDTVSIGRLEPWIELTR